MKKMEWKRSESWCNADHIKIPRAMAYYHSDDNLYHITEQRCSSGEYYYELSCQHNFGGNEEWMHNTPTLDEAKSSAQKHFDKFIGNKYL